MHWVALLGVSAPASAGCSCLLLCLRIVAEPDTTFAVVPLSVPASTPTQFVGLDSEKVVSTL